MEQPEKKPLTQRPFAGRFETNQTLGLRVVRPSNDELKAGQKEDKAEAASTVQAPAEGQRKTRTRSRGPRPTPAPEGGGQPEAAKAAPAAKPKRFPQPAPVSKWNGWETVVHRILTTGLTFLLLRKVQDQEV